MQLKDLNMYSQWVESITFDMVEGCWVAKFLPAGIVKSADFEFIAEQLSRHVMFEIIQLVAGALGVKTAAIIGKSRKYEIKEARHVCVYVLRNRFDGTLTLISNIIGYSTHVAIYKAISNVKQMPGHKKKLQRVYQTYPWLYKRGGIQ